MGMMNNPCTGLSLSKTSCIQSCYSTDECLQKKGFGATTTTPKGRTTTPTPAVRTVTTTTTTTPPPATTTAPPSLYSRFKTNCSDQLEAGVCSILMTAEDVCHKQLSIDLCPETCGICQIVQTANCHDTILNNGCKSMYVDKGICGDTLAKYTCPDSCGLCDSMVSKKIQDLIDGSNTPAPTTAAVMTTTATADISCSSLVAQPCDKIEGICRTGDVGDRCPQECSACYS